VEESIDVFASRRSNVNISLKGVVSVYFPAGQNQAKKTGVIDVDFIFIVDNHTNVVLIQNKE